MRKVAVFAVAIAMLAVVVGCGGSLDKKVVGKYTGKLEMPKTKANDPMAKMAEGMANALASSMTLELKEDKTFILTMMIPIEGKYTLDSDKITLNIEKVMGMDKKTTMDMAKAQADKNKTKLPSNAEDEMNKPMTGKVTDEGGKVVVTLSDPTKPEGGTMIFTKS